MSASLTPECEQEIRARVEAATPGPWTVELEQCDCSDGLCGHGTYVSAVYADGERRTEFSDFRDADWQFVIRSREVTPALLAEIDRLRARVAELEIDRAAAVAAAARSALEDFADRLGRRAAAMGAEYFRVVQVCEAARKIAADEHGAAGRAREQDTEAGDRR